MAANNSGQETQRPKQEGHATQHQRSDRQAASPRPFSGRRLWAVCYTHKILLNREKGCPCRTIHSSICRWVGAASPPKSAERWWGSLHSTPPYKLSTFRERNNIGRFIYASLSKRGGCQRPRGEKTRLTLPPGAGIMRPFPAPIHPFGITWGLCADFRAAKMGLSLPFAEPIMPIIVQKFGGSSVADSQKILAAARKAIRAQKEGNQVVVVVIAMGDNTDLLIDLAEQITDQPPAREMDILLSTGEQVSVALMAMAIHSLGQQAISMTAAQIGIVTDSIPRRPASTRFPRTASAAPGPGEDRHRGRFPGDRRGVQHHHAGPRRQRHNGRGPGGGPGGEVVRIYTDVDGVYTADPRLVPEARKIEPDQLRRDVELPGRARE